jgi:hypothetical protein
MARALCKFVNFLQKRYVECAWCGNIMGWHDHAFPMHFKARTVAPEHPSQPHFIHVSLPENKRILALVVAKDGSRVKEEGTDLMALCCSTACQEKLEKAWIGHEAGSFVLN